MTTDRMIHVQHNDKVRVHSAIKDIILLTIMIDGIDKQDTDDLVVLTDEQALRLAQALLAAITD